MTNTRAAKVSMIAERIPTQEVFGERTGDVLVVSWGGTYGACHTAVRRCQDAGHKVSHAHLRYLNPMPSNIGDLLRSFQTVLVPELNTGQLKMFLRAEHLVDCIGINKVQGKPFTVTELTEAIEQHVPAQRKTVRHESKAG
jgi:2-oxoglutarate ferredoxin oxidoreductase subunit alpha